MDIRLPFGTKLFVNNELIILDTYEKSKWYREQQNIIDFSSLN
jgi:hypothetical protein